MKVKKNNVEIWQHIVCLLLIITLFSIGGCAQLTNQKSSGQKYGQSNNARLKKFATSAVITPSQEKRNLRITTLGQPFRYLDGYMSKPSQQLNSDQLYRTLSANGHFQNTSTQFSNAILTKVFQFTQQREGMLIFHCVGECENVEINVSGDFYASLGMVSQFPAVWFKSPTLFRHTVYVRIANPEEVAGQQFNLQVSLWDSD